MESLVGAKVLIVEARFYEDIADALLSGAGAQLQKHGVNFDCVRVPGALEIPAAISFMEQATRAYDAYIALGCVIRGETYHFEIVANESSRGLMDLSIRHRIAIGNGILTVENEAQAWERADKQRKDKGGAAALAALSMLQLKRSCGAG